MATFRLNNVSKTFGGRAISYTAWESSQQLPFFSAHVYCGHGRPSQLLLSYCCIILNSNFLRFLAFFTSFETWRISYKNASSSGAAPQTALRGFTPGSHWEASVLKPSNLAYHFQQELIRRWDS